MQLPQVYFDSQWYRNTMDFHPILFRLSVDRIEFGLMGLFIGLIWPRNGPKPIEEILDDMGVDLLFNQEQEKMFRERLETLRRRYLKPTD